MVAVARTERVLEARAISGRATVAEIDGGIVDNDLVGGCSSAAGIAVPGLGDQETGVEGFQITVDALFIGFNDASSVYVELRPDIVFLSLNLPLLLCQPDIIST